MAETKEKVSKPAESVAQANKKSFFSPTATLILTVLMYAGSQVLASVFVVLLPLAWGWNNERLDQWLNTAFGQFLFVAIIEVIIVYSIYRLLKLRGFSFRSIGLKKPKLSDIGYGLAGFGLYFLLYLVISLVIRQLVPSIDFRQEQQIGFETARQGLDLVLVFLSLVIFPPIVEELFARGFLYEGLKRGAPRWLAVVGTSVLFAVAHLQFGSGAPLLWVAAIDTFVLSLVLIYLKEKTGGLAAPMALHMLKNGLAFTILFLIGTR